MRCSYRIYCISWRQKVELKIFQRIIFSVVHCQTTGTNVTDSLSTVCPITLESRKQKIFFSCVNEKKKTRSSRWSRSNRGVRSFRRSFFWKNFLRVQDFNVSTYNLSSFEFFKDDYQLIHPGNARRTRQFHIKLQFLTRQCVHIFVQNKKNGIYFSRIIYLLIFTHQHRLQTF